MITNIGKNLEIYCGNHAEPIPMKIMSGETAFYACPKYMLKDEKHPDTITSLTPNGRPINVFGLCSSRRPRTVTGVSLGPTCPL